jgi:hypothetical protein
MADTNTEYEVRLDDAKRLLSECQLDKLIDSCLNCSEVIGCPIRTQYVRAVFESMSKGETGGFDF